MAPEIGNFKRTDAAPKTTPTPPTPRPPVSIGERAVADFMNANKNSRDTLSAAEMPTLQAASPTTMPGTMPGSPMDKAEALEAELAKAEKDPELTYEQRITRHGITMSEAMEIVNAVFDNNWYEREYKLTGRYSVIFRTRSVADQDRILRRIEEDALQYPASIAQLLAKYNLAASMQKFKQFDFTNKEFAERLKFVQNLSETAMRVLSKKLYDFDQLMMDVLDDGAIENF